MIKLSKTQRKTKKKESETYQNLSEEGNDKRQKSLRKISKFS